MPKNVGKKRKLANKSISTLLYIYSRIESRFSFILVRIPSFYKEFFIILLRALLSRNSSYFSVSFVEKDFLSIKTSSYWEKSSRDQKRRTLT